MTAPQIPDDDALAGDDDESGPVGDDKRMREIAKDRALLEARCSAAKIPITESIDLRDLGFMILEINSGREKRPMLFAPVGFRQLLAFPFEDFVFLSGLNAICSYKTGYIEAGLAFNNANSVPNSALIRTLLGVSRTSDISAFRAAKAVLKSPTPGMPTIEISPVSEEFSAFFRASPKLRLSIKLYNCTVTQHDEALKLLRKISSSVLFQLDLLLDFSLSLQRDKARTTNSEITEQRSIQALGYPTHEYEEAPVSLYAYGRSANGMPLLQFLAFYQVVEFYFPIHSLAEAHFRIKNLLKNPLFRSDNDGDISNLLAAASTNKNGAYGDERAQLKATLQACFTSDDFRAFFSENADRFKFFSATPKTLTYHKIPLANKDADVIGDVAERIYNIRCKIVHSKADSRDSSFELLLPFSKEAELLPHDIALMQFVAKRVLIAGSSKLNLHS